MDELSKIIGKVSAKWASRDNAENKLVACNKTDETYSVV